MEQNRSYFENAHSEMVKEVVLLLAGYHCLNARVTCFMCILSMTNNNDLSPLETLLGILHWQGSMPVSETNLELAFMFTPGKNWLGT